MALWFNENSLLSKSARLTLIYLKAILLMVITSMLSQMFGNIEAVGGTVIAAAFLAAPLALLKAFFEIGKNLKIVAVVLSMIIIGMCWYMILSASDLLGESKSNIWALQFTIGYMIDQCISEPVQVVVKMLLLKSVLRKSTCAPALLKKTYLKGLIDDLRPHLSEIKE